jgi:hypothetical protein
VTAEATLCTWPDDSAALFHSSHDLAQYLQMYKAFPSTLAAVKCLHTSDGARGIFMLRLEEKKHVWKQVQLTLLSSQAQAS